VVKIAATEIVTGISGESEKMLRELFDFVRLSPFIKKYFLIIINLFQFKAKAQSPCIIIMDELDAIAQHRHNASKGMEGRIVGQLLACMDSLGDPVDGKETQVIVIGITNRLDVLDTALRRAGRFERLNKASILNTLKVLFINPDCFI
jgi:ribosome biogenesis ATPase